jgi:hypothetical protein
MNVNLSIEIARKLVASVFEVQPRWSRNEIIKEIERLHKESDGIITAQSATSVVKRVLREMKNQQLITSIGKGLWTKLDYVNAVASEATKDSLKSTSIPLQPLLARTLILKLFEEKNTWQRAELSKRMMQDHLAAGNELGTQDPLSITKKTLAYLQDGGYVETDGRGNWSRLNTDFTETLQSEITNDSDIRVNEITSAKFQSVNRVVLGRGVGSVYLYYFESEKELALLKGKTTWECKIGRASGGATERVMSQAKTSRSKPPVIALEILTDYPAYLEKVIHNSLKMVDRHLEDESGDGGVEWFDTNPEQLILWFKDYADLQEVFR